MKKIYFAILIALNTIGLFGQAIEVSDHMYFYDSGGADGDYSNNENITVTYKASEVDEQIAVVFEKFSTESCCDELKIYDAITADQNALIGTFRGNSLPDIAVSTNDDRALTFVFTSDGSVVSEGWKAIISSGNLFFNFSASLTSFTEFPTTVTFTPDILTATTTPVYSWDFNGDGVEDSSEPTPLFTYAEEGIYDVSLTITDGSLTNTLTKEKYIQVGYYTLTDDDVTISNGIINSCNSSSIYSNIEIPELLQGQTVLGIGSNVFKEKNINNILLPASLQDIHSQAFYGNNISSIALPAAVKTIGGSAFYSNNNMDITIAENSILETIGDNAFQYCNITNLLLPASVKTIGANAFYSNNNLDLSIAVNSILETIGDNAFQYCAITNLTIPSSVQSIGSSAFYNNKLTSLIFEGNSNIQSIGAGAFSSNSGISSYILPSHGHAQFQYYYTSDIQFNPGDEISDLSIKINAFVPYTLTDDDVEVIDGVITSCSYSFELKSIIIPATLDAQAVIEIGPEVFREKGLTYISLPEGLENIDWGAFYRNSIQTLDLPTTIKSIGNNAFQSNNSMNLSIGENSVLETIGYNAFQYCNITNLTLPASVKTINAGAFYSNYNMDLTIAENSALETIGNTAFQNCNITNLLLPTSVKTIGANAFYSNNNLDLSIAENSVLETIGEYAFQYCNIINLTIPTSVQNIGSNAFNSNELSSLIFEENSNILSIGTNAFSDNSGISSYILPPHGQALFQYYFSSNTQFNPGDEISDLSIGINAFVPYTLADNDVVVTDGVITSCSYSFELKSIIIPATLDAQAVTGIAPEIFREKGLTYISLPEGLETIGWGSLRDNLLQNLILPSTVKTIDNYAFYNNSMDLSIAENSVLETIGMSAFHGCAITHLTIPSSVTSIGYDAFYSNDNLNLSIAENSALETIGERAFKHCAITNLTIPSTVTSIGNEAFYNNELASIIFEGNSNILSIGAQAFSSNISLISYELPTNAYANFLYYNASNIQFNAGDEINDFTSEINVVFEHTVLFLDHEGNLLKEEKVSTGASATAPNAPMREGYTFIGWNGDFDYITEDITLTTVYTEPTIPGEINIGYGTFTGKSLPIEPYYGYTYSQSIYLKEEIVKSGLYISKLRYHFVNISENSVNYTDDIKVYLGHTTKKSFDSSNDWVALNDLTIAYDGQMTVNGSDVWVEIVFDTPFTYDSSQNLVIAIEENTAGYYSSDNNFYCSKGNDNNSIFYYSDDNNPDPANPPTGEISNYRPNIQLVFNIDYTVRFEDYDGTLLKEETVEYNSSATAPEDPTREDYIFTGWDVDFNMITNDLVVTAQYEFYNGVSTYGTYQFDVYPNPATRKFTVEGANGETLKVYNAAGSMVVQMENISNKQSINISELKQGFYLVKVGNETHRLLIK